MAIQSYKKVSFTLPMHINDELEEVGKEMSLKKSRIVASALELYFDEMENEIIRKRYEDYKKGKAKTHSFEKIKQGLNL